MSNEVVWVPQQMCAKNMLQNVFTNYCFSRVINSHAVLKFGSLRNKLSGGEEE